MTLHLTFKRPLKVESSSHSKAEEVVSLPKIWLFCNTYFGTVNIAINRIISPISESSEAMNISDVCDSESAMHC